MITRDDVCRLTLLSERLDIRHGRIEGLGQLVRDEEGRSTSIEKGNDVGCSLNCGGHLEVFAVHSDRINSYCPLDGSLGEEGYSLRILNGFIALLDLGDRERSRGLSGRIQVGPPGKDKRDERLEGRVGCEYIGEECLDRKSVV